MKLRKCLRCGSYTLKLEHCGTPTVFPRPAKWDPKDPHGVYRRLAKRL